MVWPLIPYSYRTINYDLPLPAPSPPLAENWLGTDDQGRDVVARLIYGFRISVLFGLTLTVFSSIIGIIAGAVQGYFGGWIDLALSALHRDLVRAAARPVPADHPGQHRRAELLAPVGPDAAVQLDGAGWRGARRVPARSQLRLCARSARARPRQYRNHVQARAAERDGRNAVTFLPFISGGLDHGAHLARLPRLRPAAGRALAR